MILKAFSILDTKVGTFSRPFFFGHIGECMRMCLDAGRDMGSHIGRHPFDFVLYEIGTFDDNLGVMSAAPSVAHVVIGDLVMRHRQPPLPGMMADPDHPVNA